MEIAAKAGWSDVVLYSDCLSAVKELETLFAESGMSLRWRPRRKLNGPHCFAGQMVKAWRAGRDGEYTVVCE